MLRVGLLDSVLNQPWEDLFRSAGELGFDGVELGVGADYHESALWNRLAAGRLREQAEGAGVRIASLCLHACWDVSPASPEASVREQARDLLIEACSCAANLGAGVILAPVTSGGEREAATARARWQEVLEKSVWAAEKAGVVLGLENVGSPCAPTGEEVATLADAVGSEHVAVYYDPANALQRGADPVNEILLLGDRIRQLHVKDPGGELLGDGNMDLPSVIAALRTTAYDGWLVLETPPTHDPVAAAGANLAYVRALL